MTALDVRKHFGELLDEAAAGERIVIERAGQPRAALVSLEDLRALDPEQERLRRATALDEIRRMARLRPVPPGLDVGAVVREMRDGRSALVGRQRGSG